MNYFTPQVDQVIGRDDEGIAYYPTHFNPHKCDFSFLIGRFSYLGLTFMKWKPTPGRLPLSRLVYSPLCAGNTQHIVLLICNAISVNSLFWHSMRAPNAQVCFRSFRPSIRLLLVASCCLHQNCWGSVCTQSSTNSNRIDLEHWRLSYHCVCMWCVESAPLPYT